MGLALTMSLVFLGADQSQWTTLSPRRSPSPPAAGDPVSILTRNGSRRRGWNLATFSTCFEPGKTTTGDRARAADVRPPLDPALSAGIDPRMGRLVEDRVVPDRQRRDPQPEQGRSAIHLDTCPPMSQPVWVCLGTPHPIDFVQARVIDPRGAGEVTFMARVEFHTPCPPSFFLAAGFREE